MRAHRALRQSAVGGHDRVDDLKMLTAADRFVRIPQELLGFDGV